MQYFCSVDNQRNLVLFSTGFSLAFISVFELLETGFAIDFLWTFLLVFMIALMGLGRQVGCF